MLHTAGRRFDSVLGRPHFRHGVAESGKASALGAGDRVFKSRRHDHCTDGPMEGREIVALEIDGSIPRPCASVRVTLDSSMVEQSPDKA